MTLSKTATICIPSTENQEHNVRTIPAEKPDKAAHSLQNQGPCISFLAWFPDKLCHVSKDMPHLISHGSLEGEAQQV